MRLFKDFESGMNVKSEIKSKDVKKAKKIVKSQIHQYRLNQFYEKTLQEFQQKMN